MTAVQQNPIQHDSVHVEADPDLGNVYHTITGEVVSDIRVLGVPRKGYGAGNATVTCVAPNLTTIDGDMFVNTDSSIVAPYLKEVTGTINISLGGSLYAPNLTKVGGNFNVEHGSWAGDMEALESVGGTLWLQSDCSHNFPNLTKVGGNFIAHHQAEVDHDVMQRVDVGGVVALQGLGRKGYYFRNPQSGEMWDYYRATEDLLAGRPAPEDGEETQSYLLIRRHLAEHLTTTLATHRDRVPAMESLPRPEGVEGFEHIWRMVSRKLDTLLPRYPRNGVPLLVILSQEGQT